MAPIEPFPTYPDRTVSAIAGAGYDSGWGSEWAYTTGYGPGWGGLAGGGVASIAAFPRRTVDPSKPIVAGSGAWSFAPEGGIVLSRQMDDLAARLGLETYHLMLADPVVAAMMEIVTLGILGDTYQVTPAILPEPGERLDEASDGDRKRDIERAKEYADACDRMLARQPVPFRETLKQLVRRKLAFGCSLAEQTWAKVKGGPDSGRIMLSSLVPKPHLAWAFVVDAYLQIQGIWAWTAGGGGGAVIGRDKFSIHTNNPRDADPRGTSLLRPAYDPWTFKMQAKPLRAKFLALFADPTAVLEYAADAPGQPVYPPGPDGRPDYGQEPLQPHEMATGIVSNVHSGSWVTYPVGWKLWFLEPRADGGSFDAADAAYNREIAQAIGLSARSTQESEHNSKADNEGAVDFTRMRFDDGRHGVEDEVERDLFCRYGERNGYGDDAGRLCPRLTLGVAHKGDNASLLTALIGGGFKLSPRQFPAIDAEFNLLVRSADEIEQMQAMQDAGAAALQAAAAKAQAGQDGEGQDGPPDQPPADDQADGQDEGGDPTVSDNKDA